MFRRAVYQQDGCLSGLSLTLAKNRQYKVSLAKGYDFNRQYPIAWQACPGRP
jgi:hypothetical protein